jgi:myo-inositol 2-dehydrogenase/D-chiro-inositol 1-dehydrogenase
MLGIGVLGVGQRGQRHIEFVREAGGARVVAVADPYGPSLDGAQRLLAESGMGDARLYRDWAALLNDDAVEAVIVALPNYLHAVAAIAALRRGKHVLLEKPVALTVADCARLAAAERESGAIVQVGLELRFATVARHLHEAIEGGAIGTPRLAWCHEFRVPFREKVDDWILAPERSGGTFVEKNCHHFDLLSWFLGSEPERVAASGGSDVVYREQPGMVDNAWVIVEHAGGKRASLGVSMFSAFHLLEFGILGERGLLTADFVTREVTLTGPNGGKETVTVADPAASRIAEHGGADVLQMEDFIRTIAAGVRPRVTLQDGVRSLLVALAAQRAVETGATVALADIADAATATNSAAQ